MKIIPVDDLAIQMSREDAQELMEVLEKVNTGETLYKPLICEKLADVLRTYFKEEVPF